VSVGGAPTPVHPPSPSLDGCAPTALVPSLTPPLCSPSLTPPLLPPSLYSNELDKKFGTRGWNAVVGRSFGAYVTQKIKCYAYLSVFPGVNILVWKA
jgi:hypothetical protein